MTVDSAPNQATAPAEIWRTATLTVETPRGPRYRGVSFAGEGTTRRTRDHGEALPRGAVIRYTSPLRVDANEAFELARRRTVHHNVWHDGSDAAEWVAALHHRPDCHEAARA